MRLSVGKLNRWISYRNSIFLVYSMGKVGSSTLYESLKSHMPFNDIFHVHFLSDYWLKEILPQSPHSYNIQIGKKILDTIERNPQKRLKIITLTREPISRDISNIFENPKDITGQSDMSDYALESLIEDFNKTDFSYTLNWFDTEFKAFTEFDIYSHPFNQSRGYSIYETEEFDLLVIKLEMLSAIFQEALEEFADIKLPKLLLANTTQEKPSSTLARNFKEVYSMEPERARQIYASQYVQHFYAPEEIEIFMKKWCRDFA